MAVTLPLAFWAITRDDAITAALAWADAEPNVERATVVEAEPRGGRTFPDHEVVWHVTLTLTMRHAEALTLGLA